MAITYQNGRNPSSPDFASSTTYSFNPTNADFLIQLAVSDRSNSGTVCSAMAWNGQALTLATTTAGTGPTGKLGHLVGTLNGAQNLTSTWPNVNQKPMIVAGSWAGVDQATPIDTANLQTEDATGNTHNYTLSGVPDLAICCFLGNLGGAGDPTANNGATIRATGNISGIGQGAIAEKAGSGSVTLGITSSGNPASRGYGFGVSAAAAPGAGEGDISRSGVHGVFAPSIRSGPVLSRWG